MERWRERVGDVAKKIVWAVGAEILGRAYLAAKPVEEDITSTRGFAASRWHREADVIYQKIVWVEQPSAAFQSLSMPHTS